MLGLRKIRTFPQGFLLWMGYVCTTLTAMLIGLEMSFNVYALPLKNTFNLTQTQVEIVASMCTVGMSLSFLETLCTWWLGYKVTCVIIAFGVPISSGLFSLSTFYSTFIHNWPICIYLLQFCLSTLNNLAFLAIPRVWVDFFPKEYTGRVFGLYSAAICLGKICFAALMDMCFKDQLADFFLFVTCATTVCYGTTLVILYHIATHKQLLTDDEPDKLCVTKSDTVNNTEIINTDKLKSSFLQILFWSSVVFNASGAACANNVTIIAESIGLGNPIHTVYLLSVIIITTRVSFGILFDKFGYHWCRFILLMTMYGFFAMAMSICVFAFNTRSLYLVVLGIGMPKSCGLLTPVSIIVSHVGRSHFSVVSGSFYALTSLLQTLIQVMMGYFYDSDITHRGMTGRTCYGHQCFYWSSSILLGVTLVIAVFQSLNFYSYAQKPQEH